VDEGERIRGSVKMRMRVQRRGSYGDEEFG
jgi:hypothetical protein